MLRSLERQRLAKVEAVADDGRVRHVELTRRGQREVTELDRLSDTFAKGVLAALTPTQQARLIDAMAVVEQLMKASAVDIAVEPPNTADALWCLKEYFNELAKRFESGFDPGRSISANADELTPPAGIFIIARLGGQPIGCGALKVKAAGLGEIKRMWVREDARGLGLGRRILEALEKHARELRLNTLRLETNRTLGEAQALYRRCGYVEVAPFNDEPYAHHWFQKVLTKPH